MGMLCSSRRRTFAVVLFLAMAVACHRGAASDASASERGSNGKTERRGPDSGHHSGGAIRLPIPVVDQAQSELRRTVWPCVEEARRRGMILRRIRIVSTLQVESGEVRFTDSRIASGTTDPEFDRCVTSALGNATYPAPTAPERALAMISGTLSTVGR